MFTRPCFDSLSNRQCEAVFVTMYIVQV